MATVCEQLAAPVSRQEVRSPSSRMAMLDMARFVAALSVIWIHTPRSAELSATRELGRFAVPFFVAAAVLFAYSSARRHTERTLFSYAAGRVVRIYLPFLAWSGIYLVFKAAKAAAAPDLANEFPGAEVFWAGGFYHLWFMPFILVVSVLTFIVARALPNRSILAVLFGLCAAGAGTAIAVMSGPQCLDQMGTWARLEWNALVAGLFGLALAACLGGRPSAIAQSWPNAIAALLAAACCIVWSYTSSGAVLAENLSGLLILIAALAAPYLRAAGPLQTLGALAFGIYFSHLLLIKTMEAAGAKLGWPTTWQLDVAIFVVAAAGSTALSFALGRWRFTKWLVA